MSILNVDGFDGESELSERPVTLKNVHMLSYYKLEVVVFLEPENEYLIKDFCKSLDEWTCCISS